jgi:hypothetical protein
MLFFGVQGAPSGIAGYGFGDAQTDCIDACGECGGQPCDGSDYNTCVANCPNAGPAPTSGGSNPCEVCLASPTTTDCSGPCGTSATAKSGSGNTGTTKSTGNSQGAGTPWYASIFGSIAQGTAAGLTQKPPVAVTPTSFLTSPTGIGILAIGLIVGVVLLTKK